MKPSSPTFLACSVRGCALPLEQSGETWACANGHAFDLARSGYLNLIQPQDRRSLQAGDSRATVAARRSLLDRGFGAALRQALLEVVATLQLPATAKVVDLGCGEGHFLAAICTHAEISGCGIDLSAPAVESASRRHPDLMWIAANADRTLPLRDGSFALALSTDGRRPTQELARVLAPDGHLLVAIPAADDLVELRQAVLQEVHADDRVARVAAALSPEFRLLSRRTVQQSHDLDQDSLAQLAAATYRCARRREQEALAKLKRLAVTTAHDVLLFAKGEDQG